MPDLIVFAYSFSSFKILFTSSKIFFFSSSLLLNISLYLSILSCFSFSLFSILFCSLNVLTLYYKRNIFVIFKVSIGLGTCDFISPNLKEKFQPPKYYSSFLSFEKKHLSLLPLWLFGRPQYSFPFVL